MAPTSFEDDDDDKPLDPAVERVRARLARLMLVAGLTLAIGIFAVFGAVLYRIMRSDTTGGEVAVTWQPGNPVPQLSRAATGLPADARLLSAGSEGGRLVLSFAHSGGNSLIFVDARTLQVTGRLDIPAE